MRFGRSTESASLPDRISSFRHAIELADGRLDPAAVAFASAVANRAGERLRHGTAFTLVALLGATGSGKSSLANALAGTEIATTGVRRPTTSSSLALVWGKDDPSGLLNWLDVPNRHHVSAGGSLDGLVLLDVPDHDSVAVSHRLEMERIAEQADVLLWVTDHEKYADLAMHTYLRKLAHHGAVTTMVLNKIDTLSADEVNACRNDLGRLLTADGLGSATVVAVSATTGAGIEGLREVLGTAVQSQRAVVERLTADIDAAASDMLEEMAPNDVETDVSSRVRRDLTRDLVAASGLDAVTDAVAAGHKRDAAAAMGWPFTSWARKLRPHPMRRLHLGRGTVGRTSLPQPTGVAQTRARAAIREASDEVTDGLGERWSVRVRDAGQADPAELADALDRAVAEAARATTDGTPMWWGLIRLIQWGLAVADIVGAVWLALLAFGSYLRLPDVPTPEYQGIPIPTALLVGGVLLGWLVAFLCQRLAAIGAKRRAAAVRKDAQNRVNDVVDRLIVEPMQAELTIHNRLRDALVEAQR